MFIKDPRKGIIQQKRYQSRFKFAPTIVILRKIERKKNYQFR